MTASERAHELNVQTAEFAFGFSLCVDAGHWSEYGIETGEELDAYLAWSEWVDLYKDVHGIKPRWTNWRDRDSAGWEAEINRDIDACNAEAEALAKDEQDYQKSLAATREVPVGLVWSPFAALSGR